MTFISPNTTLKSDGFADEIPGVTSAGGMMTGKGRAAADAGENAAFAGERATGENHAATLKRRGRFARC